MCTERGRHAALAQNRLTADPTLRPNLRGRRAPQNSDSSDRIHHGHNLLRTLWPSSRSGPHAFTGPSEMHAYARPALKHALHLQQEPDLEREAKSRHHDFATTTTSSDNRALPHNRNCSEKLRQRASPACHVNLLRLRFGTANWCFDV